MANARHKIKVKIEAVDEKTEVKPEVNTEAPLKTSELEEAPGAEAHAGAEQEAVPEEAPAPEEDTVPDVHNGDAVEDEEDAPRTQEEIGSVKGDGDSDAVEDEEVETRNQKEIGSVKGDGGRKTVARRKNCIVINLGVVLLQKRGRPCRAEYREPTHNGACYWRQIVDKKADT